MSIESVDQVYEVAHIHDEYVVSHPFDGDDHDTHGWVQGTITNFEVDGENDQLDMVIDLPWGETHRYGWEYDEILGGPLSDVCKAYGRGIHEFQRLVGNDIWLKLRYVQVDDGEIDTGTRMQYNRVDTGPHQWKRTLLRWGGVLVFMLIALLLI